MRAAWLVCEAGMLAGFEFEEDEWRIFAWRGDGEWFGVYPDQWNGGDIPGTAPEGLYVPQRGLGFCWNKYDLRAKVGYAVRPAEQSGEGDYEAVEGGFALRLGSDVYNLVEKPPEPEPPPPEPEPGPGPPPPEPEPENTVLRVLSLIEVLLSRLVMQRIGEGDWVWLPDLDAPLNLNFVGHVHENGVVRYGFYDTVLALSDRDVELIREKLKRRCRGGSGEDAEADVGAAGRGKRAEWR